MHSQSLILVIGGTGFVGQPVAEQLQRDGQRVRIATRDVQGARKRFSGAFEVVQADLNDETSLTRAMQGCSGVHLSLPSGHSPVELEIIQHQVTSRVARVAAEQGVNHLTYVSGYLVSEAQRHIPAEQAKLNAEEAIRRSGVPFTIFRPTYFTDILPRFVQGRRASIIGKQPHPIRFLALEDFGRMIARAHRIPGTNQALFVCGPEAMTFEEALRLYVAQAAPGAQVSHAPFWMMRLVNQLFLRGQLTETLQLLGATERVGETGDPGAANALFGAAKISVREWCARAAQRT